MFADYEDYLKCQDKVSALYKVSILKLYCARLCFTIGLGVRSFTYRDLSYFAVLLMLLLIKE